MTGRAVLWVAAALALAAQAFPPPRQGAPVFTCGKDETIPPIIVNWTSMVLIGDGRLYTPCPKKPEDPLHPVDHRENREQSALNIGLTMINPEIRWRAAQAMVRLHIPVMFKGITPAPQAGPLDTFYGVYLDSTLGMLQERPLPPQFLPVCNAQAQLFGSFDHLRRFQAGPLFQFLIDDNPEIRKEAAYAIGTRLSDGSLDADFVTGAIREYFACWLKQSDVEVQGTMLEALGVVNYPKTELFRQAEAFLVKESQGAQLKILGAVRGLEALIRLHPEPGPTEATRVRLRELVTYGNRIGRADSKAKALVDARIRRLALMALLTANDQDIHTFQIAARDDDFQMRRLIAGRLNLNDPTHTVIAQALAIDPEYQVRYEFLSSVGRWVTTTKLCEPLADRFKDPNTFVVMRAMDLISASCTDLNDIKPLLIEWTDKLTKSGAERSWHVPARALSALARVDSDEARERLEKAAKFPVWQVRAAVAQTAVALNDPAVAVGMMKDIEPNVQTAALEALMTLKDSAAFEQSIKTLQFAEDYQLLRMAAMALHHVTDDFKEAATQALIIALRRVSDQETDTSRDTRIAMLERLGEVLPAQRASEFLPYVADFDDEVVAKASKEFEKLVGAAPPDVMKRRRYPYQPTVPQLANMVAGAIIKLEEGDVEIQFVAGVAPATVARFVELVLSGFYNDRTFHRVVPNLLVQGGSPGANDFVSTSRFMRDEVGPQASHVRGAVGMSSQGTDAGDGQFFIDLIDVPNFDRNYTVFAYVVGGMEYIDALLDGARIIAIDVPRPGK